MRAVSETRWEAEGVRGSKAGGGGGPQGGLPGAQSSSVPPVGSAGEKPLANSASAVLL